MDECMGPLTPLTQQVHLKIDEMRDQLLWHRYRNFFFAFKIAIAGMERNREKLCVYSTVLHCLYRMRYTLKEKVVEHEFRYVPKYFVKA